MLPASAADAQLEAALRARLFAAPSGTPREPDPEATDWEQALSKGERSVCADVGPLRYLKRAVDLDGDGTNELIAAVVGSHACGARGCTLFVFRRTAAGLQEVAALGRFKSPLRLEPARNAGWSDLTMPGVKEGAPSGTVLLRFDGSTYRVIESSQDAETSTGTEILTLPDRPFEDIGLPLPCGP